MEDYIFLLIAVALSIFGALNQNKKKKMAESNPEEAKPRHSFMDAFLEDDFLEEPEEEPARPIKIRDIPSRVAFESSKETKKAMKFEPTRFKSTLPDRPKHVSIAPPSRLKEEEDTSIDQQERVSYMEDFSLRKAVIYSEILKPKY